LILIRNDRTAVETICQGGIMTLAEYREKNNFSYGRISRETGVHKSIIYRLCTIEGQCLSLKHANAIVKWSNGDIQYEDLISETSTVGDC
jgi:hypothetical protein